MENKEANKLTRRDFIKVSSIGSSGVLLSGSVLGSCMTGTKGKTRYAIVGVGGRTQMWQKAIFDTYREHAEVVGFCDTNQGRLDFYQKRALKNWNCNVPVYLAQDFDKMIGETKPDTVIVTTVDAFHHEYIIRAMELGCNVITEKPMTTTDEKCQMIIDAQKKTGKEVIVSFNYRYSPPRTQVKDLLMTGVIGDILSVDFHWMLNTHHGADYFRRWHSQKKFSGGLMVHKATHHFDLINWWLSAIPVEVQASGKRDFYTPEMAKRFGLESYHERCFDCPEKEKCGFRLDLAANPSFKELYLDNEKYDNYFRDRCVFRPEIDIEDTMNVIVKYNTKTTLSYSLNAFNAWEGYYVVFNGTKGRLEHKMEEQLYISGDGGVQGGIKEGETYIQIIPLRGEPYREKVWEALGDHGGGDDVMLHDIFTPGRKNDKYFRCADQRAGAYSILTGIAANKSFESGNKIMISDLVSGLSLPEYPEMPDHEHGLPMPG